jgi:hypothetical protein
MARRFQTQVFVEYGQYLIMDAGSGIEVYPHCTKNGIVNVVPGAANVSTGLHTGRILVDVELVNSPPTLETGPWTDVVEVTFESIEGETRLFEPMGMGPQGIPPLIEHPGTYRIRFHVRGRDAVGWDSGIGWPGDHAPPPDEDGTWPTEIDGVPIEQHLLQVWPSPEGGPDLLYKTTDLVGAYRRKRAEEH